jgi:hypothetical protein
VTTIPSDESRHVAVTLASLQQTNDQLLSEMKSLRADVKKFSRMTIMDGIGLAIGMFIATPLLLFIVGAILMAVGISIFPNR